MHDHRLNRFKQLEIGSIHIIPAELRDYTRFGRWFNLGVWLAVAALAATVLVFVWEAATPLISGDNWYYTDTMIKHYQEGKLGLVDIIGKRPNDNSQPINRLILLGLTQWFQMDLVLQGMLGALIAVSCVLLLSWLALRAWPDSKKSPWVRALLPLGFATILLSLNPTGLFTWPLVTTLTFTGSLGAIIYLYVVAELGRRGAWVWVAMATMITLITIDTFGILTVMGTVLLFAHRVATSPKEARRGAIAVALSVFATLVLYQVGYKYVTHMQSTPLNGANIANAASYAAAHWDETWKTFVVPFAISVYEPLGNLGYVWPVLIPLAVLVWCGHIWFWREFLRNSDHRIAFLGAGLMLYCYGTIAGMLLDRVPLNNFDYFFQPRYIAFYELQLVAMVLMVAVVLPRKAAPERLASMVVILLCGMLVFDGYFIARAWATAPWMRKYDEHMLEQLNQLVLDPAHPPEGCMVSIVPCYWTLQRRLEVLQVLKDGKSNVFSPEFLQRHGYKWVEAAPSAGTRARAPR